MSTPSDSSRNIYCPPQSYGTRMIMVPSVRRSNNIYPINCPQGVNYQMNSPIPYRIIRYNNPTQYQQIMNAYGISHNLHGNENNTNVKPKKKSLLTSDSKSTDSKSTDEDKQEDPIDLSSTNLTNFSSSSKSDILTSENELETSKSKSPKSFVLKSPKKEPVSPSNSLPESELDSFKTQGKRKSSLFTDESLIHEREIEGWVGHVKPVPGIPRQAGSKREEVLKAAKSLFSKRTRTLYHWLYPTTPQNKLKATVAAAWDTLSTTEKDFYISQVLGRFGVPAGSLMVNPQLGGFKGISSVGNNLMGDEAGRAVTNLLLSEDDVSWNSYPQAQTQESGIRKRRRQTRNTGESSCSSRQHEDEETLILKQIREESLEDDFADDPELSKEFEQFRVVTQNVDSNELFSMNLNEILEGL